MNVHGLGERQARAWLRCSWVLKFVLGTSLTLSCTRQHIALFLSHEVLHTASLHSRCMPPGVGVHPVWLHVGDTTVNTA